MTIRNVWKSRGGQEARREGLRSKMTARSITEKMTQIADKFGITQAPWTRDTLPSCINATTQNINLYHFHG